MRDIIWIQLDSVRHDHTSVPSSNYRRTTTPELARSANRKRTYDFSRCYSHGIWTPASTASILTGRPVSQHGVGMYYQSLPPNLNTIPEQLSTTNYTTIGISNNVQISDLTGLNRGFDDFQYIVKENLLSSSTIREISRFIMNLYSESAGITLDTKKHNSSFLVNEIAKRKIRESTSSASSLFLFAHYNVTHHPYYPPVKYQSVFDELNISLDEALSLIMDVSNNINEYIANGCPFSKDEWAAINAMYDATIRYADQKVTELAKFAQETLNNPIVVITSDHGEFLGEEGLLDHKISTNTAVSHVPLIVSGLDLESDTDAQVVQHSDIMKTILQDVNVDIDVPIGYNLRQQTRQYAVTQRGSQRCLRQLRDIKKYNQNFDDKKFTHEDVHSVQSQNHRYAYSDESSDLFDLTNETDPLDSNDNKVSDRLNLFISEWLDEWGTPITNTSENEVTKRAQQRLQDLGYLTD